MGHRRPPAAKRPRRSGTPSQLGTGRHEPSKTDRNSDDLTEEDRARRGRVLPAQLCLDPTLALYRAVRVRTSLSALARVRAPGMQTGDQVHTPPWDRRRIMCYGGPVAVL